MAFCRLLSTGLWFASQARAEFLHPAPWHEPALSYTLVETRPPGDVFAGETFHIQPFLTLYNEKGEIAVGFEGDVYASLKTGKTGYELLRCNSSSVASENAVQFFGGR